MIKQNGKIKASKVNITYDPYVLFQAEFFGSYDAIEEGTEISLLQLNIMKVLRKYISSFFSRWFQKLNVY